MSAADITPENVPKWLAYVANKRVQAGDWGLARCERGHEDCSPVYNGTCHQEVQARVNEVRP